MKPFMDEDFLLDTPAAKTLYHEYAQDSSICDYHCHLSPKEIYENRPPEDIAALWLGGDHYKWRAMRSCGIGEEFCTGNAAGREKFLAYARTLDLCIGNPLYHWSHLELKRYFGIETPLNSRTAPEIWDAANRAIKDEDFRPRSLILRSKVTHLCTTDDPADDLYYHKLLAKKGAFSCKVLPTFRPDRAFQANLASYPAYIQSLGESADLVIRTLDNLKQALIRRMDTFHALGGRISDQGLEYIPAIRLPEHQVERVFISALDGHPASPEETDALTLHLLTFLGREYARRGWAMELHIGPLRNNNTRMFRALGADSGFDSIGERSEARPLARFLDTLDQEDSLPKTILFNLHPKDNEVMAAMLGNFQSGSIPGKIQYGPAWWFLDTKDGMEAQLRALGNLGALGTFIGMETDSRSFTSYVRHEYFRRILCSLVGRWVDNGEYPCDDPLLKQLIQGITYDNAVAYFGFE